MISFRIDWFDLLAVQGTLKSVLQQHSSKASKQGNRPPCRYQEGRRGSKQVVPGTSVFPSNETGVSVERQCGAYPYTLPPASTSLNILHGAFIRAKTTTRILHHQLNPQLYLDFTSFSINTLFLCQDSTGATDVPFTHYGPSLIQPLMSLSVLQNCDASEE